MVQLGLVSYPAHETLFLWSLGAQAHVGLESFPKTRGTFAGVFWRWRVKTLVSLQTGAAVTQPQGSQETAGAEDTSDSPGNPATEPPPPAAPRVTCPSRPADHLPRPPRGPLSAPDLGSAFRVPSMCSVLVATLRQHRVQECTGSGVQTGGMWGAIVFREQTLFGRHRAVLTRGVRCLQHGTAVVMETRSFLTVTSQSLASMSPTTAPAME